MKNSIAVLRVSIFLIAMATLMLELSLVRAFDVILTPNMGYAVITAAVFALGLGGIYLYLFPVDDDESVLRLMPWLFAGFALGVLALRPLINVLPFDLNLSGSIIGQLAAWLVMYIVLVIPFFIAGIVISLMLSHYSEQVHSLYFFDLVGAGLGCVLLIPLINPYGPGGIQFVAAGLALAGAALFLRRPLPLAGLAVAALACFVYPSLQSGYLEYRGHANKRGVDEWTQQGLRDHVSWDPVSKVEVFKSRPNAHNFALDGGQQGSWLTEFDGDYDAPRRMMEEQPDSFYFGMNSLVHYLKRGTQPEVLVIGAAVGGETKAALVFGARRVDAIELVGEMIEAAKTKYADYSGNVFNEPRVDYRAGEGRTYLRSTDRRYDIIQMFSNNTSSSMADGSGAVVADYLQTVEAYKEYFAHLKDDGMMQINHHVYPRMLTTAAEAWRQMGRADFSRHVLVLERWVPDNLPTIMIKAQPWTEAEVAEALQYLNRETRRVSGTIMRRVPSKPVVYSRPYTGEFSLPRNDVTQFTIRLGLFRRQSLEYDVRIVVETNDGEVLVDRILPGETIGDNVPIQLEPKRPIDGRDGQLYVLKVSTENRYAGKAFIVWTDPTGAPDVDVRGEIKKFVVAFDPTRHEHNLIPRHFLDQPFPHEEAAAADYKLDPVTDNNPYFTMIRKTFDVVSPNKSAYLDGGTAWLMNVQLRGFLSSEWLNLFIIGLVSVVFSALFIFLPLFFSRHGRATWPRMGSYLMYFSCLGAGFILVELVLVQLFKKLIGYPIHTYATVIFSLLLSAGLGSLLTRSLNADRRWRWVFIGIVAYGAALTLLYGAIFHVFLAYPMGVRIAVAVLLLFPLGFLMGMPLPMAVTRLGELEPKGIPWAWGMNGFFTVFGGFLSVVLAVLFGFQAVLAIGFSIYLLAMAMYSRMRQAGA